MNEKIPTIVPDRYLTHVINKEKILGYLNTENSIEKIEEYVKHNSLVLKNNPKLKSYGVMEDIAEIMEYSNYKLNKLKGLEKIKEVVEETKKEVSNLNNIEVIYTPYFINDKNKEGFRHDVTYIKIKDELYEVKNTDEILSFLGNKEFIKGLSEYEIIKFLKEHSDLIKTNYLENNDGKITSEQIEEEIKKESDERIRNSLLNHKDDVIKERQKLEEYINANMPGSIVTYGVNSNEERIYMVKDKVIKFEGKERKMQILSELDIETLRRDFETKQGYNNEQDKENYKTIEDFVTKEELLKSLVEKLYKEEELSNEELPMLTSFLEKYIDSQEQNMEVPENLKPIAEKWYENTSVDNKLPTQELYDIYERIRIYRKNKVKLKEIGNAAFISTFAILEASLVIGLIIALIILFK